MNSNRSYEPKTEKRDWYLVKYFPLDVYKFANLQIILLGKNVDKNAVVDAMEKEIKYWINRYPIPLMAFAYDNSGDLLILEDVKPTNYAMGFNGQTGQIRIVWNKLEDKEIPDVTLDREYLETVYSDFSYETFGELDKNRRKRRKEIKSGWIIVFLWLVVVPLILALLDYYSELVSVVVLFFSFYQAIKKGLELLGKWPKSKREKKNQEEEALKRHYYYHCQLNPDGFQKLKNENLERMGKERVAREADSLVTRKN